jgi:putative copper resistance protein D
MIRRTDYKIVTLTTGLIVSRFVHILAISALFGAALFPIYGMADADQQGSVRLPWLRPLLAGASVLALVSGASWYALAASGAGISVESHWLWLARLLLAAGCAVLLSGKTQTPSRIKALLVTSLALLASLAWTGHAGSDASDAGTVHRVMDMFHLLAAAVWIGALIVFTRLAAMTLKTGADIHILHDALTRFSRIGTAAVAALALSGIMNPGFLASFSSVYGQVLLTKLGAFAAMLLLAAANRYWLTPRLTKAIEAGLGPRSAVRALLLSILTETALAFMVLFLVGWLGVLPLPALR